MTYGPCGGVTDDGACEIGGPCAFVEGSIAPPVATAAARAAWARVTAEPVAHAGALDDDRELSPAATALLERLIGERPDGTSAPRAYDDGHTAPPSRPFVVADLPSPGAAAGAEEERELAAAIAGGVDAVLLGDAPWARVQLPPSTRGAIALSEGVTPWCGINCRDRNRSALEAELAGLTAAGVPAVHCVTGDHPQLGHRADATAVFDLDSTQLATLAARTTPLLISAAEAPAAAPVTGRATRAAAKLAAGADVLFMNHCSPQRFADFAAELAALVPADRRPPRLIGCVPLVLSHAGAERIAKYLHATPPPELLAALDRPDPHTAAIALAVAHAERLLEIPGVIGVDLSAPAGPGEAMATARALAIAGRELGVSV